MKKPALIKKTVRLFPDRDFHAAMTQTTIKGHVTGRLYYSPLKSKEIDLSRIHKKELALSKFRPEILEKACESGKNVAVLSLADRKLWYSDGLSFSLNLGCPKSHEINGIPICITEAGRNRDVRQQQIPL